MRGGAAAPDAPGALPGGGAVGFVIMRDSSCCALRMSASYLRITFIVSFTSSSSSDVALSASSARAQSSVSLIDGVFFRSSVRSFCISATRSAASFASIPGTLTSRILRSTSSSG